MWISEQPLRSRCWKNMKICWLCRQHQNPLNLPVLAGMRIGYAIGNEKMISYLNDVKYSFNSYTMNQTTMYAGRRSAMEYFKTVKK